MGVLITEVGVSNTRHGTRSSLLARAGTAIIIGYCECEVRRSPSEGASEIGKLLPNR